MVGVRRVAHSLEFSKLARTAMMVSEGCIGGGGGSEW